MRWLGDLPAILSALGWLVALIIQKVLSIELATVALLALVGLLAFGRASSGRLTRITSHTVRLGLPIGSLLTMAILLGGGSLRDIGQLLGGVLTILVVLLGFYLMFRGLFRSRGPSR